MILRTLAAVALAIGLSSAAQAQTTQVVPDCAGVVASAGTGGRLYTDQSGRLCVSDGGATTPNGYQQITTLTASTALTVPAGTAVATVIVEGADVRIRKDGVAPTATVGMPIPTGAFVRLYGPEIAAARFIQQSTGAILNVEYGR